MNYSQTSRRSFINSIAVLSAGVAFGGSAAKFFPSERTTHDLKQTWKIFCKQNEGDLFHEIIPADTKAIINPCKGHFYKTGKVTHFANEDLLAQPTWIYWGKEKNNPDDVIITFYKNDNEKTKVFRINRFELESIITFTDDKNITNHVAVLKEAAIAGASVKDGLKITTSIRKGQYVRTVVSHSKKQIVLENKIIYNA